MSENDAPRGKRLDQEPTPLGQARRFLVLLLIAYLMALAPFASWQRSLIYHPQRRASLPAESAALPQKTVDITIKSYNGIDLHGWLALAGTSIGSEGLDVKSVVNNGRPLVIYFPGNGGNRSMRAQQLKVLGFLNAHVLIVDHRGYADNAGTPSEANFATDARSVWNYAGQELGVPRQRIVIYGESLGGGVAVRLASDLCQAGIEPGGLICQSTFSSLVETAKYHFPFLPVSWLLVDRYRSDLKITKVTCPILQIHGNQDVVVPFPIGQKLFDAAPAVSSQGVPKRQHVMMFTDHNDVYSDGVDQIAMETVLAKFLDDVASVPLADPPANESAKAPANAAIKVEAPASFPDGPLVVTTTLVLLVFCLWWFLIRKR